MTGYSICDQHLAMGHGMSKVLEGLYIGNYGDSVNIQQLQQHSITHILSLYNKNGKRVVFEDIQYLIVEVEDSPKQHLVSVFGECLEFIHRARANEGTVLVHCLDGVSLSSTIIVVYLLIRTTLDINTAIKVVRAVRPFANPNHGFRRQMEDWSREERKFWKHRMEMWPDVKYGDKRRCNHLLDQCDSQSQSSRKENADEGGQKLPSKDTSQSDSQSLTDSGRNSASDCESADSVSQLAADMGNSGSAGSKHSIKSDGKKPNQSSRLEKLKSAILHRKSNKEKSDNSEIQPADSPSNNNNGSDKELSSPGTYYTDNITRSATLPPNINKVNTSPEYLSGYSTNTLNPSKLQARILPAYRDSHHSKIADIRNRQRMQSTATIYRQRHDSQTSNYSHRYSGVNRVVTTHIPAHIDKKLVRSRSVGVIPDAELRMRRTASASVVKIEECEDWAI